MQLLGRASVQQQPIFFRNGESGGELKETIFEWKMGNGEPMSLFGWVWTDEALRHTQINVVKLRHWLKNLGISRQNWRLGSRYF